MALWGTASRAPPHWQLQLRPQDGGSQDRPRDQLSGGPEECERGRQDGDQWEPEVQSCCAHVWRWPQPPTPACWWEDSRAAVPTAAASPAPRRPGLPGASFPLCSRPSGLGGSPSPTEAPNSPSPGQDGPQVRASLGRSWFTSAPGATPDTPRLGDKQGRRTYSSLTRENEAGAFPGKRVVGGGRRGRGSSLLLDTVFQQRSLWTS